MIILNGKKFKRNDSYSKRKDANEAANNWRKQGYYARVLKRQKDCELIFTIYVRKR